MVWGWRPFMFVSPWVLLSPLLLLLVFYVIKQARQIYRRKNIIGMYLCIQFSGTESPSLFWLPIKNVLKFVSAEPKLSMVIYRTPVILQQKYDPNHDSTSIIRNYPPPPPYEMATKMPKVEVTWKFCKFITALVTIFDHSSVLKFLNLVKKINKFSFLSYSIS